MRVLTVGNMYPPHHQGGYELIWQSSVEHLRAKGHEVQILTTVHREPEVAEQDDPEARRELLWYWRDFGWPHFSFRERLRIERHNAATFDRHVGEFEPDAIGWWAMGGMSLSLIERARGQGLAAAGFVCDEWMSYGPRVDAWLRSFGWPLLGTAVSAVTRIPTGLDLSAAGPWVFLSEYLRRPAVDRWGLEDATVVHDGADSSLFRPRGEPPDWGWRLAYVGRIDDRKGIDIAIRSLRHLPSASLKVTGSGDAAHLEELRRLRDELGLGKRVEFAPQVEREELPRCYGEADAVLFPVTWAEPWGLVPLEAMAVGVPVIATGRGGSGEYLRDGHNCLLFSPDSGPEGLADAVERLADGDQLREQLIEGGFRTSGSIRETDFEDGVEDALERAISRRGGSERQRGAH